jgi:hypothetical protein
VRELPAPQLPVPTTSLHPPTAGISDSAPEELTATAFSGIINGQMKIEDQTGLSADLDAPIGGAIVLDVPGF